MIRNRWLVVSSISVGLFLALAASMAWAQNEKHPRGGSANIPFDFYIAGNKLPAGDYNFDLIAPTYVLMRSQDGKVQQDLYFLQQSVANKNTPSEITFAVRDGKCYFAEMSGWFGKTQLTSFTAQSGDTRKTVPLKGVEKIVAKP